MQNLNSLHKAIPLIIFVACFIFNACSTSRQNLVLTETPIHYLDNDLKFQPNRIWKVWLRTSPYWLDDKKAVLHKTFYFVVRDSKGRSSQKQEIAALGGVKNYLKKVESELHPLGMWDEVVYHNFSEFSEYSLVTIETKAKAVIDTRDQKKLRLAEIQIPDQLIKNFNEHCTINDHSFFKKEDSVGFEWVFESNKKNPKADRLKKIELSNIHFDFKSWSVGAGRRIVHRGFFTVKESFSRCPLPLDAVTDAKIFLARIYEISDLEVEW